MGVRLGRLGGLAAPLLALGGCAGQPVGAGESLPEGDPVVAIANEWRTDACATPRTPEVIETAGAKMPLTPKDVDEAITRISEAGNGRFAETFAGLEIVNEQVRVIVYRRPSAAFDEFIRQSAREDTCVVVRDALYSAEELGRLVNRISADFDYWRERGVRINMVGPKRDGSGVQVGTEDVAAARIELPKRYGDQPPMVVVEAGPVVPAGG